MGHRNGERNTVSVPQNPQKRRVQGDRKLQPIVSFIAWPTISCIVQPGNYLRFHESSEGVLLKLLYIRCCPYHTSFFHNSAIHLRAFGGSQLEEELETGLKLSVKVNEVLQSGKSDYQTVELVESEPFGKVRRKSTHPLACGLMSSQRPRFYRVA